jgi:hypothetical protein
MPDMSDELACIVLDSLYLGRRGISVISEPRD